jgi:hypothetical protein
MPKFEIIMPGRKPVDITDAVKKGDIEKAVKDGFKEALKEKEKSK